MSLSHKAFELDWADFERELGPILTRALASQSAVELELFIKTNAHQCRDPAEGNPIEDDWIDLLGDIQALADVALTKYYLPTEDFGLGEEWSKLDAGLSEIARSALLGRAFESGGIAFDPGLMGSYFQRPGEIARSRDLLKSSGVPQFAVFVGQLEQALDNGSGIYVCF